MFIFSEPSLQPWHISKGDIQISIPNDVINSLTSQDIIAINFLYQNYKNEFKGSILNEEEGFNVQAQVSTFVNVILQIWTKPNENFRLLVITPEYLLQKWSETLKHIAALKVLTVEPKTCPADFDQMNKVALLLSFDYIKFVEALSEYNFVSVVIDHFDAIANKLIIKKLAGKFNIGLTRRNFYTNPDQKLQWTMLNWIHPGSMGRLKDFYEADNDNFANLRDNYHHWWLTLTWDYCDSFKKQSDDSQYSSNYVQNVKRKKGATSRKRNVKKVKSESSDENSDNDDTHEINLSLNQESCKRKLQNKVTDICIAENDKSNLVEYKVECSKEGGSCNKETNKNKEIYNFQYSDSSDATVEYNVDAPTHLALDSSATTETSFNKKLDVDDDENILLNIIEGVNRKNSSEILDSQSQLELKKEELYSQMFEDIPKSEIPSPDTSDDFLRSLINI